MKAKPLAFDPSPYDTLSAACISGLHEDQIINVGKHTLSEDPGRRHLRGWATLTASRFESHQLQAIRDDDPFEFHTNITGWPAGTDPDSVAAQRLQIALILSNAAKLKICNPSIELQFRAKRDLPHAWLVCRIITLIGERIWPGHTNTMSSRRYLNHETLS